MTNDEKATYEDLSEEKRLRLQKYLQLPDEKLKNIDAFWAVEERLESLFDLSIHPKWGNNIFIAVSPKKLIENLYVLGISTNKLFNNDVLDFRYVTTLERWEKGLPVDPPTVYFDSSIQKCKISDGRHRLVLSFFIGKETIPISIHKGDKDGIAGLLLAK
jgi:hypothetical protein